MSTFNLTLHEVDDFDWDELIRWHSQHLRIQEERAYLAQLTNQMATATMLGTAFGGAGGQESG